MHSEHDEDDLLSAGLEILESRKALSKSTYCLACNDQMKVGTLLICAECLGEDCDEFMKLSYLTISKEEAIEARNKLSKTLNKPEWLRGIGLSKDDNNSYYLKVNVNKLDDVLINIIPKKINNVSVVISEVGDIIAY